MGERTDRLLCRVMFRNALVYDEERAAEVMALEEREAIRDHRLLYHGCTRAWPSWPWSSSDSWRIRCCTTRPVSWPCSALGCSSPSRRWRPAGR
ncbi:hypothetical protein [Streptomyces sp. NPDC059455]|uniref:hypothetical protein n=1 Tax=Streptomyces sp. NPDC059455 TaxID=3346837 RepID=UPI0036B45137